MARKESNIHYIYKTTCNVTGRWYIGMHSCYDINDGYMGSGLRLRRSIRKYGKHNHTKEILEYLPTRELLANREREIVTKELIADGLCMNLTIGGEAGGFINNEHQEKCSKAGKEAFKEKLLIDENLVNRFKELGKRNLSPYQFNKVENKKNRYDWTGKNHSEESKEKLSNTRKQNNIGIGETNSQYGTCWITNEIDNKKIFKGDEIPEGWRLGRKLNIKSTFTI